MTLSWNDDVAGETVTRWDLTAPERDRRRLRPETTLATHTARALLPERVPLRDAALNSARAGLLVEAATRHPRLLVAATRDWLHQEARRPSYAASMALVDHLRASGHAATISGAGPSVLALTTLERSSSVAAPDGDATWRGLEPGIPRDGVVVHAEMVLDCGRTAPQGQQSTASVCGHIPRAQAISLGSCNHADTGSG